MRAVLKDFLDMNKYLLALFSMFNFLLTPIAIAVTGYNPAYVIVLNFTLVILASSTIASKSRTKVLTYVLGFITLCAIWLEFSNASSQNFMLFRLITSLLLFMNFCVLLLIQLQEMKEINLQFIILPI